MDTTKTPPPGPVLRALLAVSPALPQAPPVALPALLSSSLLLQTSALPVTPSAMSVLALVTPAVRLVPGISSQLRAPLSLA